MLTLEVVNDWRVIDCILFLNWVLYRQENMSKNIRTLEIYTRLCEGKVINKTEEAERYHVDERSIQRDITDIRSFLADRAANDGNDVRDIVFDKEKKGII